MRRQQSQHSWPSLDLNTIGDNDDLISQIMRPRDSEFHSITNQEDNDTSLIGNIMEMVLLYATLRVSEEEAYPDKPGNTKTIQTSLIELNTSNKECPICMELYSPGEITGKLPCKHKFHEKCIKTWFNTNNSCPICREEFPQDAEL